MLPFVRALLMPLSLAVAGIELEPYLPLTTTLKPAGFTAFADVAPMPIVGRAAAIRQPASAAKKAALRPSDVRGRGEASNDEPWRAVGREMGRPVSRS